MNFEKSLLSESLGLEKTEVKTFSEKPQNIVLTESQLERLIENLTK